MKDIRVIQQFFAYITLFAAIFGLVSAVQASNLPIQTNTGFYLPANMWESQTIYFKFGRKNPNYQYRCHLGTDYSAAEGTTIRAVTNGIVEKASMFVGNYAGDTPAVDGGAIVIKHRRSNGNVFYALYGHVKNIQVAVGDRVSAGNRIGDVGPYISNGTSLPHLHFGINSGLPSYSGYTPYADCADYLGFVDPEAFLTNNSPWIDPEFHGAGSLISPSLDCFGCNRDTDAIHADGKPGLVLFQWYYNPTYCDHIDIAVDGMSYAKPVKIRTGAWNYRTGDKNYSAILPVSVEAASADSQYPWNVTAVTVDAFSSPATVTATCKVSAKVGTKTAEVNPNPKGIDLENGWTWQGNGSLISTIPSSDFGVVMDVVNLTTAKGAAFFQWQKSTKCKNLNITAGLAGNYKLRLRGWDSSPVSTATKPLILTRDVYLSGSLATVLNYAELAQTQINGYYLLSVYSDINMSTTVTNPINVTCSAF
jgi:hypothetical protein